MSVIKGIDYTRGQKLPSEQLSNYSDISSLTSSLETAAGCLGSCWLWASCSRCCINILRFRTCELGLDQRTHLLLLPPLEAQQDRVLPHHWNSTGQLITATSPQQTLTVSNVGCLSWLRCLIRYNTFSVCICPSP